MDYAKFVYECKPFEGVYIFDVHNHLGFEQGSQILNYDADGIVHTMDRMGVSATCVSYTPGIRGDWKWGNDQTLAACKKYPGRIIGYAVPTPFYEYDLTPYFEGDTGFGGIKIHGNIQAETPENDLRYNQAFEIAEKKGLPVLFHAWCPWEINYAADVAKNFPNAKIILGHAGLTFGRDTAVEVCKKYDNIYCDTAISAAPDGSIEWMVDKIGIDRVVYGSDMTFFDCIHTLGKIALCKLSDDDKEKIYGLTAKKLFKL